MFCGGSKFIALGVQTSECLGFLTFDHVLIKCPVCSSILTFCSGIRFGLSPPLSVLAYLIDLLVSDITSVLCGVRYALITGCKDDTVLMALPELYRFGREGTWFGLRPFILYMIDGVYQVCLSVISSL